jgi:hypothetical protein
MTMLDTFVKIQSRILSSSIRNEEYPTRLLWFSVLLLCDKNGVFHGTNDFLADMAKIKLEEVEEGMRVLTSPDANSGRPDEEGRRIIPIGGHDYKVTNYEYYRDLRRDEEKREKARIRKAKHDAQKAELGEEIPVGIEIEWKVPEDLLGKSDDARPRFETFWELYGKKVGRKKCETRFLALSIKKQIAAIEALPRHKQLWAAQERGTKYVPNPQTWLNQEKWDDEITDEMLKPHKEYKPAQQYKGRNEYDRDGDGRKAKLDF